MATSSRADALLTDEDDFERILADAATALVAEVPPATAAWVVRCVEGILDAWAASGDPDALRMARPEVSAAAIAAGEQAAAAVANELTALLQSDIDAQRRTPLQVVRAAVAFPTAVLAAAGVPEVQRDPFAEERFPDDLYGLTPASLAALDPALAEPALRWGAAKAGAHKRRHQGGS